MRQSMFGVHRWVSCLAQRMLWAIMAAATLHLLTPSKAFAQFTRFENISDEQGLGNLTVTALAQDLDGSLLIGTDAGIFRYDGGTVSAVSPSFALPADSPIRKMVTGSDGRIWVMTADGLYVRDGSQAMKVTVDREENFRSFHLLAIFSSRIVVDDHGTLLQAPLGRHHVGRFSPVIDDATLKVIPSLAIAGFVNTDAKGGLLVGCGVALCRIADGRVEIFNSTEGLPRDTWQIATQSPDGTIWARSLDRLAWRRPGELFKVAKVPGENQHFLVSVPGRIDLQPDGRGGVFTQGDQGILEFDTRSWTAYSSHQGGLPRTAIDCLMLDREGSLWAGSIGSGVFRSIGLGTWEHWAADDGLPSAIVWGMVRTRDGQLWVATYAGTVPLGRSSSGVPGDSEALAVTKGGSLWLAPLHLPLTRVAGGNRQVDHLNSVGEIGSMLVDGENKLWLATDKALLSIQDPDAPAHDIRVSPELQQPTMQVAPDNSGVLWAVASSGVYRRAPTGNFQRVIPSGALAGQPSGLAFAPNGDLWVATSSAGVLRFHFGDHGIEKRSSIGDLPTGSEHIMFIHRDRRGWMWVGTDHGIDMFDGRSWRHINVADGLISDDMDQYAAFEDVDGSMWFGSSHGLSHLLDPTHVPPVEPLHAVVTGLSMGRRTFAPTDTIRIKSSKVPLIIRFTDSDYTHGKNVVFRYRLLGLEYGWNETTGHDVRYIDLPAGKLRFELMAVDPTHSSSSSLLSLTLRIHAPWWRSLWFYCLCATGLTVGIAAAWQIRIRLIMRYQERLEQAVEERTAEIELARRELHRLAMSDALTGLSNRRAIVGALESFVASCGVSSGSIAVMLCDLDNFKKINDGYGHLAGDSVLAAFGDRLNSAITAPEQAGRYGGEEFCIVIPRSPDAAVNRALAIRAAVSDATYVYGGSERTVTMSAGLAFLRESETALSLLARADAALYRAKENGRNRIEFDESEHSYGDASTDHSFTDPHRGLSEREIAARRERELERDLRAALGKGEFLLHYQPVIDINRNRLVSCEALIRWCSAKRGMVPPIEFIPFAEKAGLMEEIGDWVLRTACREAAGWPGGLRVSVNLSAVQFRSPNLVARVSAVLAETGLSPNRLELEVTETAAIEELAIATITLRELRELGIAVALDDFGTGFSSLSFLKTLPFDRIKIDRSFVCDLGATPESMVIVRAIIGMSMSLGAAVTAEGVETDEQIKLLRSVGCSELQGYRIGRPCPPSGLQEWFALCDESASIEDELSAAFP